MYPLPNPKAPYAYVVYHANCMDGMGAALAFDMQMADNYEDVRYEPMNYGEPLRVIPGAPPTDLYILDFSFPPEELAVYATSFKNVRLIDHHKTAIDAYTNVAMPANVNVMLDANYSGAGLTWHILSYGSRLPKLLAYIQDRDLWKFELPKSKAINAYIALVKKNLLSYRRILQQMEVSTTTIELAGQVLLEQETRHIEAIIQATKRPIRFHSYEGLCCNCPGQFASEVGNQLAKESGTFGATWYLDPEGNYKYSLRSIGDFDVSELAKIFGGGGHKNAAGFTVRNTDLFASLIISGGHVVETENYGGATSEDD